MKTRLEVSREQIIAFRRRAGSLDERLAAGAKSLRGAAWAGLQDSVPRAALLSIHARVRDTHAAMLEHPTLIQLWGPRYSVYVVAIEDLAVFSLGRLPSDARRRERALTIAAKLKDYLGDRRMLHSEAERGIGLLSNRLRYAAATGTVLLRWDGARQPVVWCVPPPEMEPEDARLELARRFLHIFGPSTPASFERWAGIKRSEANAAFQGLRKALTPVRTPAGEAWILSGDEKAFRADPQPAAPARLLPSGDAFFLAWGADRELLAPDAKHRGELWTSRVWPGALLVDGELAGVWRRSAAAITIDCWRRLSKGQRAAVEAEAHSLPLPGLDRAFTISWSA